MNLFELVEQEAETLLKELKARCEQLRSAFGSNAHAHIDPIVASLEAHVATKTPSPDPIPVAEPVPAPVVAAPAPAPAPVVEAAPAPVVSEEVKVD